MSDGKSNPMRPDEPRAWSTVTYTSLKAFLAEMARLHKLKIPFQASVSNWEITREKKKKK